MEVENDHLSHVGPMKVWHKAQEFRSWQAQAPVTALQFFSVLGTRSQDPSLPIYKWA